MKVTAGKDNTGAVTIKAVTSTCHLFTLVCLPTCLRSWLTCGLNSEPLCLKNTKQIVYSNVPLLLTCPGFMAEK